MLRIADLLTFLEQTGDLDVRYHGITLAKPLCEVAWDPDKGGWSLYTS